MIKQLYYLKVNLTLEDGKRDFKQCKQALGTKIRLLMINALSHYMVQMKRAYLSISASHAIKDCSVLLLSSGCIRKDNSSNGCSLLHHSWRNSRESNEL